MDGAAAVAADPRKVKLLCSYGGHIIPRPSDGALRYAGGQTRIVAVPRTASLPDIHRKLAAVFGAPAAIRYQLPDVDLDALVSVSSPEDLDNMMEEYDKIAETAPDGSAKLRVFLDISPEPSANIDYVEAVNRVSSDGSFRRANSGNNSGGTINGGMSPELLSPNASSSNDPNRLFFVGVPEAVPVSTAGRVELELSPYSSQPYGDPSQLSYLNPQLAGPAVDNVFDGRVQSDANVPYQGVSQQLPLSSSYLQENIDLYGLEQVVQQQPLGQGLDCLMCQKALPHAHSDTVAQQGGGIGEVSTAFHSLRPEDAMKLHAPPRVVAEPMAESMVERRNGNLVAQTQFVAYGCGQNPDVRYDNEKIVVPNSKGSDQLMVMRAPAALGLPGESMVEQKTGKVVAPAQFAAYKPPTQEIRPENEKLAIPNSKASGQPKPMLAPAAMGLPSDTQASNAVFVNIHQPQQLPSVQTFGPPQYLIKQDVIAELCSNGVAPVKSHCKNSLQQQQQQPFLQPLGQPQHVIKQDGTTEICSTGVYTVKGVNSSEPLNLVDMPGFPYNYASQLEGMTAGLHVNPFDSVVNGERNPTGTPNRVITKEFKPEIRVLAENNLPVRSQVVGNPTSLANGFSNPIIMPEKTYVRAVDTMMPSSLGFTQLQNLQPPLPSQISTEEAFFFNQETGHEPIATSGLLNGMLEYSINAAQSNHNLNKVPNGVWKEEASQYPKNVTGDLVAPSSTKLPFPFPDSCGTIQHTEWKDEPVVADPHFSNQDHGKIVGSTNLLPPRPARVVTKGPAISKDITTENLSLSNLVPNKAPLLDDGVFHQPSNSLINDSYLGSPIHAARDFGEEKINKQLQAVAEGAAASVLQSLDPPVPVFVASETKKSQVTQDGRVTVDVTSPLSGLSLIDHKIEIKETDKLNPGFLIGDEIGRLQIIKNSDLEELRELGSGTFGTVYHGKWRGSDVAIKRINNRCFSGKPSEQERSRVDFWNEASKLSDLHHPNVVAFYGVVVDGPGGSVATVTEYMVNGSLRQALHKNDKILERSKRLLIAMDVAFGMEYLHGRNIVHFDLKSDNLLVNLRDPQRPICKVGDLGLSKVKCQTLISGGVRGTLPWMAPELLNGSSNLVSDKVDVFSFGIVMWEMLTGKEPYAEMHYGAIIGGIVNNTLRPPVPESCEPDWRLLMEKCWSSESSERPSFTEIASALRAMAASPPMKGRQHDQQPVS